MPATPHVEKHFLATDAVRDVVIGMSDGLTVPFALAAGLAGAVDSARIVVAAGLAEIAAGAVAMGLGGFLAARTDIEHYASEYRREAAETEELPDKETEEVRRVFRDFGLPDEKSAPLVEAIREDRERWVRFMMRFELGLEAPDPRRAPRSALTIGGSYVLGGLIPLLPYLFLGTVSRALPISVASTLAALFVFGGVKGRFTGVPPLRAGAQTLFVGGIAAGVAFLIARLAG